MKDKQNKKIVSLSIIVIVLITIIMAFFRPDNNNKEIEALLDLGEMYLIESDYASAILVFDEAIALEPKCTEAYFWKAQAQCELGLFNDAINTLKQGIVVADNPKKLEKFLNKIYLLISKGATEIESNTEEITDELVAEETIKRELLLNYEEIVRFVDTKEPEIKLEIISEDVSQLELTWESSNTECVTVSQEGVITCHPVEGYAWVSVTDGERKAGCTVWIKDLGTYIEFESESIRFISNRLDTKDIMYYLIQLDKKPEKDDEGKIGNFSDYVYYSGDVVIPKELEYKGKVLPITMIDDYAFKWSSEMESITIPAFVKNVGESQYERYNPFLYCTNLKEIIVDEKNEYYKSESGVMYTKDGKMLVAYPANRKENSFTIPKEVEYIYEGAFVGCHNLKEILVGEGNVRYESVNGVLIDKTEDALLAYPIGKNEKTYQIPVEVKEINSDSFYMSKLEKIDCGKDVTYIDFNAFNRCYKLVELQGMDNVERISDYMINECPNLTKIGGGEGTKEIYWDYWSHNEELEYKYKEFEFTNLKNMINLEKIYLSPEAKISLENISCLSDLDKLTSLQIGDANKDELEAIGNIKGLKDLNIGIIETDNTDWIKNLDSLENLTFMVKDAYALSEMDLSYLYELEHLTYLQIDSRTSWSSEWDESEYKSLKEKLIQQIQDALPECQINIYV